MLPFWHCVYFCFLVTLALSAELGSVLPTPGPCSSSVGVALPSLGEVSSLSLGLEGSFWEAFYCKFKYLSYINIQVISFILSEFWNFIFLRNRSILSQF